MSEDENSKKVDPKVIADLMKMLGQQQAPSITSNLKPKPIEQYKFWKTQPVLTPDTPVDDEGPIENKTIDEVRKVPQNLPEGFEWTIIDVNDQPQLEELYELLYGNYVEDEDEQFRFRYSPEFLRWALLPPGWYEDLCIGVRVSASKKLVASISGIPTALRVRKNTLDLVEINFLCVHKRLRSKRLAPVLIREITRRVNLKGIWQALYTGGTILPTPIATCRYYHRSINWPKLYDVGFAYLPPNSSEQQEVARLALDDEPKLPGFRQMTEQDLEPVLKLLTSYLSKFDMAQVFTIEELRHWLLTAPSVVHAYVVEKEGKITDFVSFYGLESTVLGKAKYSSVNVAYTFYYATDAPESSPELKSRLNKLFETTLIVARNKGYDVLNALTLMDNPLFLKELKFGMGDGLLHFYVFNYRAGAIAGGMSDTGDLTNPGGVGVVML